MARNFQKGFQGINHYINEDGTWKERQGYGPYRLSMIDDPSQFSFALASLLRLYDFDLNEWELIKGSLKISATTKKT